MNTGRWAIATSLWLASASAAAQDREVSLAVLTSTLDFGVVVPDAAGGPLARVDLSLRSPGPWQLAVVMTGGAAPGSGETVAVRGRSGVWVPLQAEVPVPLAAGMTTAALGTAIAFEVKATASLDLPAGSRQARLTFLVNHRAVEAEVALAFVVPTVIRLQADPRPLHAQVLDASHAGTHAIQTQAYWVTSNVPWTLKAQLQRLLKVEGALRTMRHDALSLVPAGGKARPILPNQPVVLATGAATGRSPRFVELRLMVATTGDEPEGEYSSELQIVAEPAAIGLRAR